MKEKIKKAKQKEITLKDFIEENYRLLQVLAIFTTLSVFSSNLPLERFRNLLSTLLLSASVLVWLELWARFPKKYGTWRLSLFETLLSGIIVIVILYWFLVAQAFIPAMANYVLFVVLFSAINQLISKAIKKCNLPEILFKKKTSQEEFLRYAIAITVVVISLILAFLLTNWFVSKINYPIKLNRL
ncbi:MAG: hypothetical protein ACKKMV_03090 [Candidatus Nealsonbacteria bacterium]